MRRFQNLCGFDVEEWGWLMELDEAISYDNLYLGVDMRKHVTENGGGAVVCGVSLMGHVPVEGELWLC